MKNFFIYIGFTVVFFSISNACSMLGSPTNKSAFVASSADADNWDIKNLDNARNLSYMNAVEKDVMLEMNKLRSNPKKYAELYIKPYISYYKGKQLHVPGQMIIITQEGVKAAKECFNYLIEQHPVGILKPEEGLKQSAYLHVKDQSQTGQTGHTGSNGSSPFMRIALYGETKITGENIAYGSHSGRDIVVDLLIDDGVPSRSHRLLLLSRQYTQAGVATGTHNVYRTVCVIDFAAHFKAK